MDIPGFFISNISKFVISCSVFTVVYALNKLGILYQLFHKVDITSTRHGGELVADVLKAHGIKYLFTLVGGHISPILVACEKMGIKIIDTRHEATAVFAADAVARLSGSVGVAAVTAGPGLTNTVTAVKNAQMAESPVLLMGGAAASILKGRGALQDIDQMVLFKPLCKFTATVKCVRDIVPTIRKALQVAQSGTPGPVFIEFPIDVLYNYQMVSKEILKKDSKSGNIMQKIANWYIGNYLANIFSGAWEKREVTPLPVHLPMLSLSKVQDCVQLVSRAKKPVVLIGSQATLPPTPINDLRKSLEELGIPCFLGGMARGLLGKNSSIQARQRRKDALKEADLVILAGSVCDFRLSYGRTLSKKSKIIAVNRNKAQLYKADPASFIVSLQRGLKGYKCDAEWPKTLRERDDETERANKKKGEEKTEFHLNPVKVLQCVEEVLDENSILVVDGGDFVGTAAYILRPRGPLSWLDPGAFGTLGVGGGFALGAKLVHPESEVWIIYGDGSLGYSVAEFDTYTRFKTPVIAVVGNDACWSQIAREQVPLFGSIVACGLEYTRYDIVAKGFGGDGVLLNRDNEDKIVEELMNAKKKCKDGSAVLVNCLIGKSKFREGSISV